MTTNQPQSRVTRDSATREETVRMPREWLPPSHIPEPRPEPGFVLHWKRASLHGTADTGNMNKALREGWEPCKLSDHPELKMHANPKAEGLNADIIEMGGLILCRMPVELRDQREAYYRGVARDQQRATATKFQSDAKAVDSMPLLSPAVRTQVEFGKGRSKSRVAPAAEESADFADE